MWRLSPQTLFRTCTSSFCVIRHRHSRQNNKYKKSGNVPCLDLVSNQCVDWPGRRDLGCKYEWVALTVLYLPSLFPSLRALLLPSLFYWLLLHPLFFFCSSIAFPLLPIPFPSVILFHSSLISQSFLLPISPIFLFFSTSTFSSHTLLSLSFSRLSFIHPSFPYTLSLPRPLHFLVSHLFLSWYICQSNPSSPSLFEFFPLLHKDEVSESEQRRDIEV